MSVRAGDLRSAAPLRWQHHGRLLLDIAAGLVVGIIDIPIEISFAALLFSGSMAGYVSSGVGLLLFGALVLSIITALTSSHRGMVSLPQDSPAAVLALVTATIVGAMPPSANPQATFVTIVAALAITSLLSGLVFLVLGWCRQGSLIRYVPYPVIGGFLAGAGWLLFCGAMGVMIGAPFRLSQIPALMQASLLVKWLPALLLGVLLLVVLRRHHHSLILPAMLASAIALFYLVLGLTGTSLAEASDQGWLLGPFSAGALWPPFPLSSLRLVHWPAIVGQAGNVATIIFISVVSLLLTVSALELTVRRDMDLNRELKSAGLANLVAGLGGSPVGYQALSLTVLGHRMGAAGRLLGIVTGLLCGATLFFGAPVLSYFPRPVLGGLLLFLGLGFLVEWIYDAWFRLSKAEYGIVLLILIAMDTVGVLAAVGLGLVFAVALFIFQYSRVPVVKYSLSGSNYTSNVDRPWPHRELLHARGPWLYILELQGFLFFGTANGLLEQVRRRLRDPRLPTLRFAVLDFRQVSGLDASAELSFVKMMQVAQTVPMVLVFTNLSPRMLAQLTKKVLTEEEEALWHVEIDLDHGVEWCEEQILRRAEDEVPPPPPVSTEDRCGGTRPPRHAPAALLGSVPGSTTGQLRTAQPGSFPVLDMMRFMERKEVPAGHCLIRQGEAPRGLYFVEAGQVTARRECEDGTVIRLRKMGPGTVVGEMGLYGGTAASASVVTDEPSVVCFLSTEALEQIEETEPEVAVALHRYVAQLLGERLARANDTVQALLGGPEPSQPSGPTVG